jgi:hypothetical protein
MWHVSSRSKQIWQVLLLELLHDSWQKLLLKNVSNFYRMTLQTRIEYCFTQSLRKQLHRLMTWLIGRIRRPGTTECASDFVHLSFNKQVISRNKCGDAQPVAENSSDRRDDYRICSVTIRTNGAYWCDCVVESYR